ncbi:SHOCT domain-containing protein [Streptomyces sp. NPDC041068]|uniref:SHOCT domain-containing protein n=1 Tax=Streptomyces sp. NPDC041068 TaxID=3155130 RepID=UPI0033FA86D2
MHWHDNRDMSGWDWFTVSTGGLLFWALIIAAVVLLVRALNRLPDRSSHTPATGSAEQILSERFARGEIDEDEYQRRLTALRASGGRTVTKH